MKMMNLKELMDTVRVKMREKMNPLLAPYRQRKLIRKDITIISNNCWGGHVYRYFGIEYLSPTIGLYFYADDYIKFCSDLKYYIDVDLKFTQRENSKHADDLIKSNKTCPIGLLDDIEVIFLHYKSEEEAYEKWNRRKARIIWDNIVYKFSEQNCCEPEHVLKFSQLPVTRKFCFVTKNYGYTTDVLWSGPCEKGNIPIDTILFRDNINCINFINGSGTYKLKQKKALKKLSLL